MVGRCQWLAGALGCLLWSTAFAGTVLVPGVGGSTEVSVTSFQDCLLYTSPSPRD